LDFKKKYQHISNIPADNLSNDHPHKVIGVRSHDSNSSRTTEHIAGCHFCCLCILIVSLNQTSALWKDPPREHNRTVQHSQVAAENLQYC